MTEHWSVAQIYSKRARRIVEEVGRGDRGAFHPYYERQWISSDGKPCHKTAALMPGYLFVEYSDGAPPKDIHGRDIEGLIRVLPGVLRNCEYERIRHGCDLGLYDDREPSGATANPTGEHSEKRRRRRPRKSRRHRPGKWGRLKAALERKVG